MRHQKAEASFMLSLVMPRWPPTVRIDLNKPSDVKAAREREAYKIVVT